MTDTARTVVITAASHGIGAAAVRAFADRGDHVQVSRGQQVPRG